MNVSSRCPGIYCGRVWIEEIGQGGEGQPGRWSECGACPRGWRVREGGVCAPCDESPGLYQWLYLGAMALLPLALHSFCIDYVYKRATFNRYVIGMHLCALLEVGLSCVISLLVSQPMGSFSFKSCKVKALSDWYTLMHNPTPDYDKTLYCTQEAVYPLYTLVLIMYVLCIVFMMIFRYLAFSRFFPPQSTLAIYCGLYFLPILILIHAIGAGLIYYSFPYIIIIISMMSCASHYSLKIDQSMRSLLITSVTDVRNIVILISHWLLHAYGIISITNFKYPILHGALLGLTPAPAIFYILTAQFTDPIKIHND